ncbi:deaminase [Pilimelia anulata]|uniref:Deaminase n=1 Tax=Pilimelia anulata TaxID=53371 RepID=A0A8J3B567_9ACTN|nr:dihydrofolate reductase family protein [Pilimelia anulata]GGJ87695.1 deaminase [Pilimelia anulata]
MRELTYLVAVTIDGYIAGPDGGFDFFAADAVPEIARAWPETMPAPLRAAFGVADAPNRAFDTVLMGRATYALGLPDRPSPYPHLRQYVVSATLADPDPAVTVIRADPLGAVRRLKAEPGGGIWLCGGGKLAAALLPEIDALVLKVNPVLAGDGIPLFAGTAFDPRRWDLTERREFAGGVVAHRYAR